MVNLTNKNILVTGGNGLIGSHLVEALTMLGSNIIIPYRSLSPNSYFSTEGLANESTLVICDIKDSERVFDIVSKYEIDVIFHLAAQPLVPVARINPSETLKTNILGTINILEAARRCPNVKAVVVASSDKAYGVHKKLPYTEDFALHGSQPYDVSKSCTDLITQTYFNTYDLPVAITRCGNVYGPGDLNMNRIIPGAIRAAMLKQDLDIRSDGKMIRDYIYVKDVVRGYIKLAEKIEKIKGKAYNFSSGKKMDVLKIAAKVWDVMDVKVKTNILSTAKAEIPKQYLSSEKAKKDLGWVPIADMDKALKETVEWYRDWF